VAALAVDTGTVAVVDKVAVGIAAVDMVVVVGSTVAAGSTVVVVASVVVAIVAVDIPGWGLVVVASLIPLST